MVSPKLCGWQTQSMSVLWWLKTLLQLETMATYMPWKHCFLTVYSWDVCFVLFMKYVDIYIRTLKLVSTIFYQVFIFHQMIALSKLWKMFFISSKKLFLFSRYSDFCISVFCLFLRVSHCFRGWSKINLEIYDVFNCLWKNVITYLFDILRRKKGMTLKLCPLIEY